jgi:hypothetical protein
VATFAADGTVYVAWNPMADNGSPITGYAVTATDGVRDVHTTTISASDFARLGYAVVTGVTNGTPYTVTVRALNALGSGEASLPAAPVTPHTLAGAVAAAPTGLKARPSADAVGLQWTPPTVTGDTPVIAYEVSVSDGRTVRETGRDALITQPTAHAMLRVINGLTPGTAYTFTIAAITANGPGTPATIQATTPLS